MLYFRQHWSTIMPQFSWSFFSSLVIWGELTWTLGKVENYFVETRWFAWKMDEMGAKKMNIRSLYCFWFTAAPCFHCSKSMSTPRADCTVSWLWVVCKRTTRNMSNLSMDWRVILLTSLVPRYTSTVYVPVPARNNDGYPK